MNVRRRDFITLLGGDSLAACGAGAAGQPIPKADRVEVQLEVYRLGEKNDKNDDCKLADRRWVPLLLDPSYETSLRERPRQGVAVQV